MSRKIWSILCCFFVLLGPAVLSGCTGGMINAIDNKDLSDTIFLDADKLAMNTGDMQNLDFQSLFAQQLENRGMAISQKLAMQIASLFQVVPV